MHKAVARVVEAAARWSGHVHVPVDRRLTSHSVLTLSAACIDGSVLLGRMEWYLSNMLIPGFWSHAAIYRRGYVVEAIEHGVVETPFGKWVRERDYVAVMTPHFATRGIMAAAAEVAYDQVGLPYDYEFEINSRKFYCAELVWWAYKKIAPGMPFELRERLGRQTISPQDFYDAKKHWKLEVEL